MNKIYKKPSCTSLQFEIEKTILLTSLPFGETETSTQLSKKHTEWTELMNDDQ